MTVPLNLPLVGIFCVSNLTMATSLEILDCYFLKSAMALFFFCFCFVLALVTTITGALFSFYFCKN